MYSLFKKEIKAFFGSLTGYVAVLIFLIISGLFLWIFPGVYNIPENGYATLEGFFSLAPWLYLFLVPAITMRFFSEEKRSGTIELLITRPVSDFKIVFSKFLAGVVLVLFSLVPALIYFLSVYLLGNPVGSIDTGATWGSFIGLFFLAAIYVAIGLFASSLTDNQIVSFILAMTFSFIFFLGFDFFASTGIPYIVDNIFSWLSINNHYMSASRGVIDLRDIVYFVGMTLIFFRITVGFVRKGKWGQGNFRRNTFLLFLFLPFLFFGSTFILYRIDLTSDKRYSLSEISKKIAADMELPMEIEFFLDGELEPGLRKVQQEVFEKIAVLNVYSGNNIRLKVTDPYNIRDGEKRDKFIQSLVKSGISPTSFRNKTEKGVVTKLIFPGAVVRYNGDQEPVNFLKYNPDFTSEANINHSVESVEFELVRAFRNLMNEGKSTVAFLEGHGEAGRLEVYDFARSLSEDFIVKRITTDSLAGTNQNINLLIIANPDEPFSEKDKFLVDQFIMHGGKTLWLVDPVQVSKDSLSKGFLTFAFPRDLNLDDQLFHYGVRLNYELLQDVECARLRVNTAPAGSSPLFTLHPWYYSPLLIPNDNHPLSRNINRVFTEFVSSVDTVSGDPELQKSIILSTSPYARRIKSPSAVSLQNIDNPPARELFNQKFIPVGVLVEGKFLSVFENRMTNALGISSIKSVTESPVNKMVVIADGGMALNSVDHSSNPPSINEMGYDRVSGKIFGNKEFLLNTVYYLNDERGIMQLRNRTRKLRLLDKVRMREELSFWQWLNVFFPLLIVVIWGLIYNLLRRRRYSRS